MKLINDINNTLLALIIGILGFGILCQVVGMWFVESPLRYTLGLWIGVCLAVFSAIHMYWSIDRNLTINGGNKGGATASATKSNLIRYGVILIIFTVICVTDFAYPLAAFLGIMSLKPGAYLTPLIKKILNFQ